MTDSQKTEQADKIIRSYMVRSGAIGFLPMPIVDTLGLIATQRLMLFRLAQLHNVPFSKHLAKSLIGTLMSGIAPITLAPVALSLLKFIPVVGSLSGGAGIAMLNGAATYAVGKVFDKHFAAGGTLEDFDPATAQEALKKELEVGRKIYKNTKKE